MLIEEVKKSSGAEKVIGEYLLTRTDIDTNKEKKSLKECMLYIMGEARKKVSNGCCCLTDEEVFGMAVHYYDEDEIVVKDTKAEVKAVAEKDSIMNLRDKALQQIKEEKKEPKPKKKKKEINEVVEGQLSLF